MAMLGFFATVSFAQEQKKVDVKATPVPETTEVKQEAVKAAEQATPVSNEEVKKAEQFEPTTEKQEKVEAVKKEEQKTEEAAK